MNTIRTITALTLALGLAAPAMADGFGGIDLPHLTFPPAAPATVTQGNGQPLAVVPGN